MDPIVTVPHPPPHFVLDSISPELRLPLLQLYAQGSQDIAATPQCHCEIELAVPLVEEDDPTVVLEARWFIDYDPADSIKSRPFAPQTLNQGFDSTATIRSLSAFFFSSEHVNGVPGYHLVEIEIGEKAGFDPSTSAERPYQSMLPGFEADIFRFPVFVTTTPDPSRPTCGIAPPPSVKVCQ